MKKRDDTPISILLADDDKDDHFFFNKALKTLPFHTQLETVDDGEKLMAHLLGNTKKLPDVLFLDHNMPRKKGLECFSEIKLNSSLKDLPVILYSTYLDEEVADMLHKKGAHFYIRKTNLEELKRVLHHVFTLMVEKKFTQPAREYFILSPVRYNFPN